MSELDPQYTPRVLLKSNKTRPKAPNWFQQLFVQSRENHTSENFEQDDVLGTNGSAKYTDRDGGPNVLKANAYDTKKFEAPYVYEEKVITPKEFRDSRLAGETVYMETSPEQRKQKRVASWMDEMNRRCDNLEEKQLAEIVTTGELTGTTISGREFTVSYGADASQIVDVSAGAPWSTTSTDIFGQLGTWSGVTRTQHGRAGANLIMGTDAAAGFEKNTAILAQLDNRRLERGTLLWNYQEENDVTYLGQIKGVGFRFDCWCYQGQIDGAEVMAAKKAIIVPNKLDIGMHYGPIENLESTWVVDRFAAIWKGDKGKSASITMESSPLPVLNEYRSLIAATVIA